MINVYSVDFGPTDSVYHCEAYQKDVIDIIFISTHHGLMLSLYFKITQAAFVVLFYTLPVFSETLSANLLCEAKIETLSHTDSISLSEHNVDEKPCAKQEHHKRHQECDCPLHSLGCCHSYFFVHFSNTIAFVNSAEACPFGDLDQKIKPCPHLDGPIQPPRI